VDYREVRIFPQALNVIRSFQVSLYSSLITMGCAIAIYTFFCLWYIIVQRWGIVFREYDMTANRDWKKYDWNSGGKPPVGVVRWLAFWTGMHAAMTAAAFVFSLIVTFNQMG